MAVNRPRASRYVSNFPEGIEDINIYPSKMINDDAHRVITYKILGDDVYYTIKAIYYDNGKQFFTCEENIYNDIIIEWCRDARQLN